MENKKTKVIVGLSGGVDSAVALINLINEGYDVEAMFMRNWDSAVNNDVMGNPDLLEDVCPQEKDYQDAVKVAEKLGVKIHRVDFIEEYWNSVFAYFLEEYRKNRTPNPDILCNKEIKFKTFLDKAVELGADFIAMGHYAKVIHDGDKHYLLRGVDGNKDQTYFLSQLTSKQLAKALFPIGHMEKPLVREVAREYDLVVANKKDSTGVCFIGERNFKEFLMNYIPANPGDIISTSGEVVGRHDGVMYYTIGQRRGLKIGGPGEAWFVCGKDTLKNQLIVGQGSDTELLYANRVIVTDVNIINGTFENNQKLAAKFRYRQPDEPVTVRWIDDTTLEVLCDNLVKAITPGQACAFYKNGELLGGGLIDKVYKDNKELWYL